MIHFNINLGKGLQSTVLRDVFIMAMKIWIDMSRGELSSADLISQIQFFYLEGIEYKIPFSTNKDDVLTWWRLCNPICSDKNYIKQYELLTQFQHNFNTIFNTNTGGVI